MRWIASGHTGYKILSGKDVEELWGRLFAPQGGFCASPLIKVTKPGESESSIQQVQAWICGHERFGDDKAKPDWQGAWDATVASLGPRQTP